MDGLFGSDDSRGASSAGSRSRSPSPASSDRSQTPGSPQHSDGERSDRSYDGEQAVSDEEPASDNEQAVSDNEQVMSEGEQAASDGEQIASDGEQAASDDEQAASDGEQAASDADQAASDGEQAASDADQAASDVEQAASDGEQAASDGEQAASDGEQAASDADQAASDVEQAASDADQAASDADQAASDADQAASDAEQAASDAEQAASDAEQAASDAEQAASDGEQDASDGGEAVSDGEQAASDGGEAVSDAEQATGDGNRSEKSYRSSPARSIASSHVRSGSGEESDDDRQQEESADEQEDDRPQEGSAEEMSDDEEKREGDRGTTVSDNESRHFDDQSGDDEDGHARTPARTPARSERRESDLSDNEGSGSEVHRSDEEEDNRSEVQSAVGRSDVEASGDEAAGSAEEEHSVHLGDEGQDRSAVASGSESEGQVSRKRTRPEGSEAGSGAEEGSDIEVPTSKRARSSSLEEKPKEADVEALFGEGLGDLSSDEEASHKRHKATNEEENNLSEQEDSNGRDRVRRMGDNEEGAGTPEDGDGVHKGTSAAAAGGDEEEEEVPVPETRIDVEIPRIVTNLGSEVHFVKLPNFLSVDTRPYDPQWYEDEVDEDEVLDEEGRARLKLKVENTVRWRYTYDKLGNALRESNTRIIKWSDGSMSLHLGSEIFDVHKQSLMQGDHNHLFIRQGTGLQGQAVFRTKLSFRPHSTDSFTHRKMTLSLAGRSQKTQKIRVLPQVGKDPEAHRSEMIKKEEDKLRASIRRESKQRRLRERAHNRGLSAGYLEGDEDDTAISLSAIKNKYRRGGAALKERPSIYSSDDDASDAEDQRARRLEKAKGTAEDDDSDLDYFDKKAESKKTKKAIEESDEDD